MNKKGFGEIQYIVFIAIFICFFSVLSAIFKEQIFNQRIIQEDSEKNIIEKVTDSFANVLQWTGDQTLGRVPIINEFWKITSSIFSFAYIHPYLTMLYLAFFGLPLGYIILRLVRGGG